MIRLNPLRQYQWIVIIDFSVDLYMILSVNPCGPISLWDYIIALFNRMHEIGVCILKVSHAATKPNQPIMVRIAKLRIDL